MADINRTFVQLRQVDGLGGTYLALTRTYQSSAVALTSEHLEAYGASAPRVGEPWNILAGYGQSVSGTDTLTDLSGYDAVNGVFWAPYAASVAGQLTCTPGDGNYLTVSVSGLEAGAVSAGMYRFQIHAYSGGNRVRLISGPIEILPAIP